MPRVSLVVIVSPVGERTSDLFRISEVVELINRCGAELASMMDDRMSISN